MAERRVEDRRLAVARVVRPGDGFGRDVGDRANHQRSRAAFERCDPVERTVADQLPDVDASEDRVLLRTGCDGVR